MKGKRFSEEQIIAVLKESEAGAKTQELCRRHGIRLLYLPSVLHALGKRAEAEAALEAQVKAWDKLGPVYVAQSFAFRDENDLALAWLERAYRQKDSSLFQIVGEPLFERLADDPRYKAFLRKMNLPESTPRVVQ